MNREKKAPGRSRPSYMTMDSKRELEGGQLSGKRQKQEKETLKSNKVGFRLLHFQTEGGQRQQGTNSALINHEECRSKSKESMSMKGGTPFQTRKMA